VGGGPAGMEAARVAALRGHQVTLYEKRGSASAGWAGQLSDSEIEFIRRSLNGPRLWRRWGMMGYGEGCSILPQPYAVSPHTGYPSVK